MVLMTFVCINNSFNPILYLQHNCNKFLVLLISGILVTATQQSDNKYDYNIVTVVLLTEVLKLVISSALYCKE